MAVPSLDELIRRYDDNRNSYRSNAYNEMQCRGEFIDPFFQLLGWDVRNEQGYAEAYKQVTHCQSFSSTGSRMEPDYCFRIGGQRKFFVEAKKPAVRLFDGTDAAKAAFQLRRYAWSAKLPLSILTNFEEFAVYDCRVEPSESDPAGICRALYLTYEQYVENFHFLADIFSPESIQRGSFDKYAFQKAARRGTAEVDEAFLAEIEAWRKWLASDICKNNPRLSVEELNFSVQAIIDRIVFLRICEDRGIEPDEQLKKAILQSKRPYGELLNLFHRADEKYNSGLFHFKKEKGRSVDSIDTLTPGLKVSGTIISKIIGRLYYPQSPYEFSVIPAEILGQVYEQFLGQVITLDENRQANVVTKPHIKKEGGVFYTPSYVVDFIVERALAPLYAIGGTKWRETARNIRIVDPACGSGSFLLVAYQKLLDWHLRKYMEDTKAWSKGRKPVLYEVGKGDWRLTSQEKKRILLNNIFGVDSDAQAVEVTKLSLLLKVLEGENQETLAVQGRLFEERALPDLENNIKYGNALVDPTHKIPGGPDPLLRAFDWEREFPEAMASGGFDVLVGNPPYVDIKTLTDEYVDLIFNHYSSASNRVNLFAAFVERSLQLLKPKKSRLGMIVPSVILTQDSYKPLRELIMEQSQLATVARLPNELFGKRTGDVKVDSVVFITQPKLKSGKAMTEVIAYHGYGRISEIDPKRAEIWRRIPTADWEADPDKIWSVYSSPEDKAVLARCEVNTRPLVELVDFCLGLTPYDKYKGHTPDQIENEVFHSDTPHDATWKPFLAPNAVARYQVEWHGRYIKYGPHLGAMRKPQYFTEPRILVKQIIDWTDGRIWAAYTEQELYNSQNAFNILEEDTATPLFYVLGILNSSLMSFYHRKRYLDESKMRFQKILLRDCKRFPFRRQPPGKQVKGIADCAKALHDLQQQIASASTPSRRAQLKRDAEALEKALDAQVFKLYGLSDAQMKHVLGTIPSKRYY